MAIQWRFYTQLMYITVIFDMSINLKSTTPAIIWGFAKPCRIILFVQIIIYLLWSLNTIIGPYFIKLILDEITTTNNLDAYNRLTYPSILYLSTLCIFFVFFRFNDYLQVHFNCIAKNHICQFLVKKLLDEEDTSITKINISFLINKIDNIFEHFVILYKLLLDQIFGHLMSILFAFIMIWKVINIDFAIVLLIWITLFITLSYIMSRKANKLSLIAADTKSKLIALISDILNNLLSIVLLNRKTKEMVLISESIRNYINAMRDRDYSFLKINTQQSVMFVLLQAACLYLLIKNYYMNNITAGDFALIFMVNLTILDNITALSLNLSNIIISYGNINDGLLVFRSNIKTIKKDKKAQKFKNGSIIFKNVKFYYQNSNEKFCFSNVQILPGEKIAIVGHSGSGKSTFVNLMLKILQPTSGNIYINNTPLSKISSTSLRKDITYIPQESVLFDRSVYDNISCADSNTNLQEVKRVSRLAKAHHFIESKPNSYSYKVGVKGSNLSGGERQRIILARALLRNSKILVFDEFTNQLDSITEKVIYDMLKEFTYNKTLLIVTHNLNIVTKMDKILVFHEGKIADIGTHQELLYKSCIYKELIRSNTYEKI